MKRPHPRVESCADPGNLRFVHRCAPDRRGRGRRGGFTIPELLLGTAVTATMAGLCFTILQETQDAWGRAIDSSSAFREARAALGIVADDLKAAFTVHSEEAGRRLPFEVVANDFGGGGLASTKAAFFTIKDAAAQKPEARRGDVCLVGYYVAYGPEPGRGSRSTVKLHRYFRSSDDAFTKLRGYLEGGETDLLGDASSGVDPVTLRSRDEPIAYNVVQFRMIPYRINDSGSLESPETWDPEETPAFVDIVLRVVGDEAARKFTSSDDWQGVSPLALRYFNIDDRYDNDSAVRTFTTRVDLRSQPAKPIPPTGEEPPAA